MTVRYFINQNVYGFTFSKQDDVALRTEVIFCMKKLGLSIFDVPCIEEIDVVALSETLEGDQLKIVLVDHNNIFDESLETKHLVEIIDHHQNYKKSFGQHVKLTLEMVGSCATLVMKRIWKQDSNFQVFGQLHNPILRELNAIKLDACRLRILHHYFCRMKIH